MPLRDSPLLVVSLLVDPPGSDGGDGNYEANAKSHDPAFQAGVPVEPAFALASGVLGIVCKHGGFSKSINQASLLALFAVYKCKRLILGNRSSKPKMPACKPLV